MAEVLIDTDVFVDHLRGARPLELSGDVASYSTITRCELFAGTSADEPVIDLLLSPFRELPVDRHIAELAGRTRRTTGIRTPDALIAATALAHGLLLKTRNARDFRRVAGLQLT